MVGLAQSYYWHCTSRDWLSRNIYKWITSIEKEIGAYSKLPTFSSAKQRLIVGQMTGTKPSIPAPATNTHSLSQLKQTDAFVKTTEYLCCDTKQVCKLEHLKRASHQALCHNWDPTLKVTPNGRFNWFQPDSEMWLRIFKFYKSLWRETWVFSTLYGVNKEFKWSKLK